jgi:putative colanic acid biosysnthesis UDP-glucose lipid carrier transferase
MMSFGSPCDLLYPLKRGAKRLFDVGTAVIGLILFSPTILLVALAIKLDSRGPIFSIQIEHSYGGQIIHVIRFRKTFDQSEGGEAHLTRMGRMLGWTGLEDLPMLWNVLIGEMSIVGPCAYTTTSALLTERSLGAPKFKEFKPGLTGWAQVRTFPKYKSAYAKRQQTDDDLFYVANWSPCFDPRIILMILLSKKWYALLS